MLIEFCVYGQNSFTQGVTKSYTVAMTSGNTSGAVYSWSVLPAEGTSSNISAINGNTAEIIWDGIPGVYTLSVTVIDGNNCKSDEISQQITILSQGDLAFVAAYPSTIVCSDLADGNEGSNPAHNSSEFAIVYSGDTNLVSAKITVANPEGKYIDLNGSILTDQLTPEITLPNDANDKQIDFSVIDTWENIGSDMVYFTIKLLSVVTDDAVTISADTNNDITRTIGVRTKPILLFSNK